MRRPPTIYLAGPINGCTDDEANGWREGFMRRLPRCGFIDPMVRDYRGREDECVAEIVEGDKCDIRESDILLAYCWQASWGTAMEIYYAHEYLRLRGSGRVILVIPAGARISPWQRYHSDAIMPTLEDAAHREEIPDAMMYFANPSTGRVPGAMDRRLLGAIATPAQGNRIKEDWDWCADNGCFGKGYPGDAGFLAWLDHMKPLASRCKFATAPDVVADAAATLKRSRPFLSEIRGRGYPAAFIGQDGQENLEVPWGEFDAFFIGGSTEWKLGDNAKRLAAEARTRGKWVHMGRVNSFKRLKYADDIGCHSADGTYLTFGPDVNLPKLLRWLDVLNSTSNQEAS